MSREDGVRDELDRRKMKRENPATDHAAVILRFVHAMPPAVAALAALEQELTEAKQRIAYLTAEAHGWQPRLAKAEEERDEWKREAHLSKWPKEAAQEYHRLKADNPRLREALRTARVNVVAVNAAAFDSARGRAALDALESIDAALAREDAL